MSDMVFSKEKRPTEPGFYWARSRRRKVVCEVFRMDRGWALWINHTDSTGDRLLSQTSGLVFGDRISAPTVIRGEGEAV